MDLSTMSISQLQSLIEDINKEINRRKRFVVRDTVLDKGSYLEYKIDDNEQYEDIFKRTIRLPVKLESDTRSNHDADDYMEAVAYDNFNHFYSHFEELGLPELDSGKKAYRTSDWACDNYEDPLYATGYQEFTLWYKLIDVNLETNIVFDLENEREVLYVKYKERYHYYIFIDKKLKTTEAKLKYDEDKEVYYVKSYVEGIPKTIKYFSDYYVRQKSYDVIEHKKNLEHMLTSH